MSLRKRSRYEIQINSSQLTADIRDLNDSFVAEENVPRKSQKTEKQQQEEEKGEEEEISTPLSQLVHSVEKTAEENGLPQSFFMFWGKMKDRRPDSFYYINKLAGVFLYLKNNFTTDPQKAKLEDLKGDAESIDLSNMNDDKSKRDLVDWLKYPFPVVSFFVNREQFDLMPRHLFTLFYYNQDPTMVDKFTQIDTENGKCAYHPYYMLIDQFSLQMLRTGDYAALFHPGNKRNSVDDERTGRYSVLNMFYWIDIYPPGSPDHETAQRQREKALRGAFEILYKNYQELLLQEKKVQQHFNGTSDESMTQQMSDQ